MLDAWSGKKNNESKKDKNLPLASREADEQTIVWVKDVAIGGSEAIVMAGPCSVESREQIVSDRARRKRRGRGDSSRRRV